MHRLAVIPHLPNSYFPQAVELLYALGLLWLAFLGTRLLAGLIVRPGYEAWIVLFAVMLAAVTLGNRFGFTRITL